MVPDTSRLLRPLVRPRTAFEDDPPDGLDGLLVVCLAGLLVAASLAGTALVLGEVVSGTATVDNPEKPSTRECTEPTGWPDDMDWYTPSECTLPDTVDVSLGGAAQQRLFSAALGAPFALGLVWLSVGGAGYLLSGAESFTTILGRAGWAFLPVGLLWPVRAAAVALLAPSRSYPATPDAVRESASEFVLGTAEPLLVGISLVGLAWAAYVLVGALVAETGSTTGGVVAASPLFAFGLLAFLGGPDLPTGSEEVVPLAVLLLALIGVPLLVVPRGYIQFQKTFELIGFRNRGAVEPEDWYVALHRISGLLVVGGATVVLGASTYLA
jgi:hypothetical protein